MGTTKPTNTGTTKPTTKTDTTKPTRKSDNQAFPGDEPHNCETDHRPWPTARRDDGTLILVPQTYRVNQMLDALKAEIVRPRRRTRRQRELEYSLMVDYSLAKVEELTNRQLQKTLWSWAEIIDRYFFFNALTRGSDPIASISVVNTFEWRIHDALAYTGANNGTKGPITFCRYHGGAHLDKLCLLHVLIHEMCHVFTGVFNCNCKMDRYRLLLGYPSLSALGPGHGPLWEITLRMILSRVRHFGPELDGIITHALPLFPSWLQSCERPYMDFLTLFSPYQNEWTGRIHDVHQGNLVWRGKQIGPRKGMYYLESYIHTRAPDYKKVLFTSVLLALIMDSLALSFIIPQSISLLRWMLFMLGPAQNFVGTLFRSLPILCVTGALILSCFAILFLLTDIVISLCFYTSPLFTGCTSRRRWRYSPRYSPFRLFYELYKALSYNYGRLVHGRPSPY